MGGGGGGEWGGGWGKGGRGKGGGDRGGGGRGRVVGGFFTLEGVKRVESHRTDEAVLSEGRGGEGGYESGVTEISLKNRQ